MDSFGRCNSKETNSEISIIRRKHIKQLVKQLLAEVGCDHAPVDVEQVARHQNAIVHRQSVDDKFSGFLFRNKQANSAVIGVNRGHASARQRFTIAHEVGHLLLHGETTGDPVHIDEKFQLMRRDETSSEGTDLQEIEANLFAAELLMPEEFLVEDIRKVCLLDLVDEEAVRELARQYKVSAQAMTIRLTNLGYL